LTSPSSDIGQFSQKVSSSSSSSGARRRVTQNKYSGKRMGKRRKQQFTTENGDGVLGPAQEVLDVAFPLQRTFNTTYTTCQSYSMAPFFTTSTTVPTASGVNFTLSSFTNAAGFAQIFDQYRIDMIEITLYSNSLTTQSGLVTTAIDYDNSAAPSNLGAALAYNTAQTKAGGASFKRTWVPGVDLAAYAGAFTAYANKRRQWIDCNSTTVQHYGLVIAATATSTVIVYDAVVRAVISFRNNI
jgi:hypothetical protein